MHHKRKRPKSTRAGCLMCKYWKHQRYKDKLSMQTWQEQKARVSEKEQREDLD